jgi:hypothetical protein
MSCYTIPCWRTIARPMRSLCFRALPMYYAAGCCCAMAERLGLVRDLLFIAVCCVMIQCFSLCYVPLRLLFVRCLNRARYHMSVGLPTRFSDCLTTSALIPQQPVVSYLLFSMLQMRRQLVDGHRSDWRSSLHCHADYGSTHYMSTNDCDAKRCAISPPRGSNSQPSDGLIKSLTLYPIELGGRRKVGLLSS